MFETKDISIFESGNGGDISILGNDIALTEQLFNQVYLALFGGNIEAETEGNELPNQTRLDYWGNALFFGDNRLKQFNSVTEKALMENPLTSVGRINILRAVQTDLASLKSFATFDTNVQLTGKNQVTINIKMMKPTGELGPALQLVWDNAKKQLITSKVI